MASIKMLEAFNKRVVKALQKLGAISVEKEYRYELSIETKAGLLEVSLHKEESPCKIYSIFSRFEDVDKANKVLTPINKENLNTYSGKFNFHYRSSDTCLEVFLFSLKEIL